MRDTGIARGGAINRRVSRLRTASSRRRQRPPVSSRKLWQLAQNCDANLACKTRCAMNRNPFEKWLNRVGYKFIISVVLCSVLDLRPSEASRFDYSVRLKATEIGNLTQIFLSLVNCILNATFCVTAFVRF